MLSHNPFDPSALSASDHACFFYRSFSQQATITARFIASGLKAGRKSVWIVSPAIEALVWEAFEAAGFPDASRYVATGQLEVVPDTAWYLRDGHFDSSHALAKLQDYVDRSRAEDYAGFCISGGPAWLRSDDDLRRFTKYERQAHQALSAQPVTALCTYALSDCSSDNMLEVMSAHPTVWLTSGNRLKAISTRL